MIKIRLSRGGTKKRPVYKVVIADSRRARDGRFIEKVGFFNPLLPKDKKERVGLEAERIKYWLGQGAQPTTRVARILGENGIIAMPANGSNPNKAIPKKERKKEGDEAAPAAAPAPAAEAPKEEAPKAEAAPAAEAPKEEAPKAEAAPAAEAPKEEAPKAEAAPARQKLLKQKQLQQQKLLKQKQLQQQKLQRKKLNSWIHVASSDIHTLS